MSTYDEKKIVILHNFDKNEYAKFLTTLNSTGLGDNTIVAVTTPTTLEWRVRDLLGELLLEDESLKGRDGS